MDSGWKSTPYTPKTPKIRGFQTFQAEFAIYLPFIGQKIVVAPCGSCGAATFFLPKNQRRVSQERNTHRRYNMLFVLPCKPFRAVTIRIV